MKAVNGLIAFWEAIEAMPEHCQKIFHETWDMTGRPIQEYPKSFITVSLANHHACGNFSDFCDDFIRFFPNEPAENILTYWRTFLAGAKYVADNIWTGKEFH